jgi:hypothetical protein
MAERKPKKQAKRASQRAKEPIERRFPPSRTHMRTATALVGFVGAFMLGAGVFGQWIREPAASFAPYLVAAGALMLVGSLVINDLGLSALRVGDAGVALEKRSELERIAWCDMQRIHAVKGSLVIEAQGATLRLPIRPNAVAIAWLLRETVRRIPDVLDVKAAVMDQLPKPREDDGELVPIRMLQIAGRRCKESEKLITFEADARLCPKCAQVYHKESVPQHCATCREGLAGRTWHT